MLNRIKKLLGLKDVPEEVSPLYRGARDEREALILLREARRRDEARRRRAMQDLEVLDRTEAELLEEGQQEGTETRRLLIARRIKEIRGKMQELNHRIENIYNKRIQVFNEHISSLETVLELSREPLPDKRAMEEIAIRARELLEDLEKAREVAEGISLVPASAEPDEEEKAILREMERPPSREAPARGSERPSEEPEAGEKKAESPKREPEPPEVLFEE